MRKTVNTGFVVLIMIFLLCCFVTAASYGANTSGNPATTAVILPSAPADPKPIPDASKYHLQALIAKQQTLRARLDTLIIQFISVNPQARTMQEEADGLAREQSELMNKLCTEAKLELTNCTVDAEKGTITVLEEKTGENQ